MVLLWRSERRVFMGGRWDGQFQYLLIQHGHAFPVALLFSTVIPPLQEFDHTILILPPLVLFS
jgi:hypothetical protein